MTLQETALIMDILTAAYPHFYGGKNAPDEKKTLSLWASVFADDDVKLVAAAVKAIVVADTREFPPTIAAVKEKMRQLVQPNRMTEAEAWNIVSRAARNGLYGSEEEFKALPAPLKKLVGSPEQLRAWAMMDSDTLQSVVASNFQRAFKVIDKREQEEAKLPRDVMTFVSGLAERLQLEAGEEKEEV